MMGIKNEQGSSVVESAIAFVILLTVCAPLLAITIENPLNRATKMRARACLFAAELLEMEDRFETEVRRDRMSAEVEMQESDMTIVETVTVQNGDTECRLEAVRLVGEL